MSRVSLGTAATLALFLSAWGRGSAQPPPEPTLPTLLGAQIAASGFSRVGFVLSLANDGSEIFAHNGALALNPASNMKILTAAAALLKLGPTFRMRTSLFGRIDNGEVADLVLRGFGDPTLGHGDLVELGAALADRGVRRVGTITVDGNYFDDQVLPPSFDQQPNEIAPFRASVGAVAVDRGSYVLRVLPGPEVGSPARVRLVGAGYFEVDNQMTTSEGGAPRVVAVQRPAEDRLHLALRGTVPAGILGVSYRRRLPHPRAYAGHAMADALRRNGIRTPGHVRVGSSPSGLPLLATRQSVPLAQLLSAMGKESDNFTAEMVLKVLGAERRRPGSSSGGLEVIAEVLAEAGVQGDGFSLVNGSGLFEGNRIAASHLTRVLCHVYQNPAIQSEYLSHLAVGGSDGTLRRRFRDLPTQGIVRAKTGTLDDVIALSGYVLGRSPEQTVAFSFLANGIRGHQAQARALADSLVQSIATHLWASGD